MVSVRAHLVGNPTSSVLCPSGSIFVGLTFRAMQRSMNIDEPDSGALLLLINSGATPTARDLCDPQLEVELAFVIGERVFGTDVTADEVLHRPNMSCPR